MRLLSLIGARAFGAAAGKDTALPNPSRPAVCAARARARKKSWPVWLLALFLALSPAIAQSPLTTLGAGPGRAGTVSNPSQICSTNLVVWYDAKDAATITLAGSDVSQWNDKSGNGYNVAEATNRPAYSATTVWSGGNKPGLTFDGTSDVLATMTATVVAATSAYTFFGHAQLSNTAPVYGRLIKFVDGVTANELANASAIVLKANTAEALGLYRNGDLALRAVTYNVEFNFVLVDDGTNSTMYIDGTGGTSVSTSGKGALGSPGQIVLGAWGGLVGELGLCKVAADATQRSNLFTWLSSRW